MARTKIDRYEVHEAELMAREDLRELKRLYTSYRDIAHKRLMRLGQDFSWTQAYKGHANDFPKLSQIDDKNVAKAFSDLSKFLTAKASTVTGQKAMRAKTIKSWNEKGIALNEQNYEASMKILTQLRKEKKVYGSDDIVMAADAMLSYSDSDQNTLLDNLDDVMENVDTFAGYVPDKGGYRADDVLGILG